MFQGGMKGYQSLELGEDEEAAASRTAERIDDVATATSSSTESIKRSLVGYPVYLIAGLIFLGLAGRFLSSSPLTPLVEPMESNGWPYSDRPIPVQDVSGTDMVMHISDTHVDYFFDPTMSLSTGVCHSCMLSTKVYGNETSCPHKVEPTQSYQQDLVDIGYAFGRYACNPPKQLWKSLHEQMLRIDASPAVVIFTGDISPHGFPDDGYVPTAASTTADLCDAKFVVTEKMVQSLVGNFPDTKWAFTMGNNDHFPKDKFWLPYIKKLGDMFLSTGFFTLDQHRTFVKFGSSKLDVNGVRYLSIDFTLFVQKSIISFEDGANTTLLDNLMVWIKSSLADAQRRGLKVYVVGHQPMSTNKGKDEMDVDGAHFNALKDVFELYQDLIVVGLFGHRNLAGLSEVLSSVYMPLFPAITAPGVSPRGRNQPSFNVLYQDQQSKKVVDFEQWKFDLMRENKKAASLGDVDYLGTWSKHEGEMASWQTLSGTREYTTETLKTFLQQVVREQDLFFAIERWERGGYVGDETPESYECKSLFDRNDQIMTCLFPNQDPLCWDAKWMT